MAIVFHKEIYPFFGTRGDEGGKKPARELKKKRRKFSKRKRFVMGLEQFNYIELNFIFYYEIRDLSSIKENALLYRVGQSTLLV